MTKEIPHYRLTRPPGSTPLPNNGWAMNASEYLSWADTVRKTQLGKDPTLHQNGVIILDGNRLTIKAKAMQGESSY